MKALDRLFPKKRDDFFDPFNFTDRLPDLMKSFWDFPDEEGWNTQVDVIEKNKEIIVKADLPGVEEKDLNVELHDNILTISGQRENEKESSEGNVYRFERFSGSFARHITLPDSLDESKIDAIYKKGVLTITIPKVKETAAKKITVKVR